MTLFCIVLLTHWMGARCGRRARAVITKYSNEGGTVANTVANTFVALQKRSLVMQSRHWQESGTRLLVSHAIAHFIRGASSRIPTLSKAISSTMEALVNLTPRLILDTCVFEATMDIFSEIQAATSRRMC